VRVRGSTDCTAREATTPAAPRDLSAGRFDVGMDEYAILEWPIAAPPEPPAGLTAAEGAVAALAAEGLSNAEIARRRGTALRTVANQMASIFAKLAVGSRHELAIRLLADRAPERG
jgi:DNA-binding CsgD family transcriptional regulator